jgi:hypothetical protein
MNDRMQYAPQFPGEPPSRVSHDNSKGIFAGFTSVLTPRIVNNFRYGFTRQSVGDDGQNPYSYVSMWNLADQVPFARATNVNVPLHQFVDDVSWGEGKHVGVWRQLKAGS